jgi:hypothetical protein
LIWRTLQVWSIKVLAQSVAHRTLSGAPGCGPRELAALRFSQSNSTKIYRTVRCATGLFGVPPDCSVSQWNNGQLRQQARLGSVRVGSIGSARLVIGSRARILMESRILDYRKYNINSSSVALDTCSYSSN